VNGIGRRTTSLIEKLIENIIRRVVPGFHQCRLGLPEPILSVAILCGF